LVIVGKESWRPAPTQSAEPSPRARQLARAPEPSEFVQALADPAAMIDQPDTPPDLEAVTVPRKVPTPRDEPLAVDVVGPLVRGRELADPANHRNQTAADAVEVRPSNEGANEPPRQLPTNLSPEYPADARRERKEGRVVVGMVVSAEGDVVRAYVVTSSGTASLDAAALAAVRRWKFIPARRDGIAVEHELTKPFRFRCEP
jgi:protein TonB